VAACRKVKGKEKDSKKILNLRTYIRGEKMVEGLM